jgi:hypothetical protein
VAQNFEWFEQGNLQRTGFPSGFFQNSLNQSALFASGLPAKKFARLTSQAEHLKSIINGWQYSFLCSLNIALQASLLLTHGSGPLVKEFLRDPAVELIHIHGTDTFLDLLLASLQLSNTVLPGRILRPIGFQHSIP